MAVKHRSPKVIHPVDCPMCQVKNPTQREIGKALGISQAKVSNLMADGKMPRAGTLCQIVNGAFRHHRVEILTKSLARQLGEPESAARWKAEHFAEAIERSGIGWPI